MSRIRSKQVIDFNSSIDWTAVTSNEIPNSRDIQNSFIPEDSMIVEDFTGSTVNSSAGQWQLTLLYSVQSDNPDFVNIYVNGVKTNGIVSVSGDVITVEQYPYDIESDDNFEVHYIKTHTV